jgi:hypothetical protein
MRFIHCIGGFVMSTTKERLFESPSDPEPSTVPLDDIAALIAGCYYPIEREARSLVFPVATGETRIEAVPVHLPTYDGHEISEIVTVRTVLSDALQDYGDVAFAQLNMFASLGAMVRDPATGGVCVASRFSAFVGDDDAWRLYTMVIALAAIVQADGIILAAGKRTIDLPGWSEPSAWTGEDFAYAEERFRSIGLYATHDETGLTAEIPWVPGALSAALGDDTALLTFSGTQPHPALGNGLFYKLELPVALAEDELTRLANVLNNKELAAIDAPPFFGAWCVTPRTQHLAYVGFWPNVLHCLQGTVGNISSWMLHRTKLARNLLIADGAEGN